MGQPFIEEMGGADQEAEYVSTLEAVSHAQTDSYGSTARLSARDVGSEKEVVAGSFGGPLRPVIVSPAPSPSSGQPRTRWIVPKDISTVGHQTPLGASGQPQALFVRPARTTATGSPSVGVALKISDSATFAVGCRNDQDTLCEVADYKMVTPQMLVHDIEHSSGTFGMRKLIRKLKLNYGRKRTMSPLVSMSQPQVWSKEQLSLWESSPDAIRLHFSEIYAVELAEEFRRIELAIADQLRGGPVSSSVAALHVDAVVCTLPDIVMYPELWPLTSEALADCPLFQHAKILPHSAAMAQYFLDTGALGPPSQLTGSPVLVLTCDCFLVESTPHVLQAVSPDHVEIAEFDTWYMAELAG
jgi:hypothetical protein